MKQRVWIAIIAIAFFVIAFVVWRSYVPTSPSGNLGTFVAKASYQCDGGKGITASYYTSTSTPPATPGEPPTPGGSVYLVLSDGRTLTLHQTISGSGIRYANLNESIVFWSKGNGAFVQENGTDTYNGCVRIAPDPGGMPNVYENGVQGFSIRYPDGYAINKTYKYQALGPGKAIPGVSFTIPAQMATGTNLAQDSYISVEHATSSPAACNAGLFLAGPGVRGGPLHVGTTTDAGVTYSIATSTDAGVGNRYEETVYAIPGTSPCLAVRYFIHYNVLQNYPPGTVQQFDKQALLNEFDRIRRTLVVAP